MPTFKPKPGQIDYTKAHWAPVINCVLKYKDKILIVKRGNEVGFYKGYWNGIAGFLDDNRNLEQKVKDEVKEETGLSAKDILKIIPGQIFDQKAPEYKKTWIVHPVLVKVKTDKIKLDWEAQEYQWIKPSGAKKLKLMPGFDNVLRNTIRYDR